MSPLQKRIDGAGCRIRDQSGQSVGANLDAATAAANEHRLPDRHHGQSDRRMAVENKNPGLRLGEQRPA